MTERWHIWLDDTRPTPQGYTHTCRWPEEVTQLLLEAEQKGIVVERISLDHDLGEFNREHNRTGYDVLSWLENEVHTRNFIPPRTVAIHTDNAPARDRMMSARHAIYTYCQQQGIDWRR